MPAAPRARSGGALAGESGLFGEYRDGNAGNTIARALVSGAAGCAGAVATGSKCAQAAVTAAFASLYNGDSLIGRKAQHERGVEIARTEFEAAGYKTLAAGDVAVRVPGFAGARFFDLIVQHLETAYIVGVEVKTGIEDIILKPLQVEKDVAIMGASASGTPLETTRGDPIDGVAYRGYTFANGSYASHPPIRETGALYLSLQKTGIPIRVCPVAQGPC